VTLEQIIETALRHSLERRAMSAMGIVPLVEAGRPATVKGIFYLDNVAADIAAAVITAQAAVTNSKKDD
jgi:hypothetical protein